MAAETALDLFAAEPSRLQVLLADNDTLRTLNEAHRMVDEATDVLSFPAPEPKFRGHLGEVAVSLDFARLGAEARGVPVEEEAAMLTAHGALHLLGFEDESEAEREAMVAAMNRVAEATGLTPDPNWASIEHGGGA